MFKPSIPQFPDGGFYHVQWKRKNAPDWLPPSLYVVKAADVGNAAKARLATRMHFVAVTSGALGGIRIVRVTHVTEPRRSAYRWRYDADGKRHEVEV